MTASVRARRAASGAPSAFHAVTGSRPPSTSSIVPLDRRHAAAHGSHLGREMPLGEAEESGEDAAARSFDVIRSATAR